VVATEAISIRQRVLAANTRIQRVKRLDRIATAGITLGGLLIIVGVLFMFLFILAEAWPIFRPARGQSLGVVPLEAAGADTVAGRKPLAVGIDEYQRYLYAVQDDAQVAFFRTRDGALARVLPVTGLSGARVTAASRSTTGDSLGLGTADGRAALVQVRFLPRYEEQRLADLDLELRERGVLDLDPARRPIREIDYHERDGVAVAVALVADDEILLARRNEDDGRDQRETLRTRDGERITHLRLGRTDSLVAATERGRLYFWELVPEVRLAEVRSVASRPITAIEWMIGGNTLLVGDAGGQVSAWFRVRQREEDTDLVLVKAHEYAGQGVAIRAIGPSPRDRSFVTGGADGSLVLRHGTSQRRLLAFEATGQPVERALVTPKADGVIVLRGDGRLARYEIENPHPEVSWAALLRRIWYEGYPRPEYVWQSTGASDDFEPKFSLVPLVFGTIKGTLYAMLFAVPLAVMAALYTSQFAHPTIRQRVKPTVEIMAALPSVVIGFIAGLWLASRVERHVVPALLMLAVLPAFGTAGVIAWERLPHRLRFRLKPGTELTLIVPLLALGGLFAAQAGPLLEGALFGGDFRAWLSTALDLVYDQRNSLVVGLAMGFAVIPIIFTISEDSFSSVPSHLTAASLALGASRWQTALRVVLPTASPGVFSAIMVGFGRAVGETMIVLMATGNTPVLDWSIFNGMRTLSANIAVEIPEAPHGGTLYRVLFLAALVLFAMTFVVNTIAELVRQRLRERYRAL
jgi:phosphate transport system permease protein